MTKNLQQLCFSNAIRFFENDCENTLMLFNAPLLAVNIFFIPHAVLNLKFENVTQMCHKWAP